MVKRKYYEEHILKDIDYSLVKKTRNIEEEADM
jgi:hypothetical protein